MSVGSGSGSARAKRELGGLVPAIADWSAFVLKIAGHDIHLEYESDLESWGAQGMVPRRLTRPDGGAPTS